LKRAVANVTGVLRNRNPFVQWQDR